MKKYLILSVLIFLPFLAKADAPSNVYFFGDGKGYNVDGTQEYFCFGTGQQDCYNIEGVFSFVREAQSTLASLQNTVNDLKNQITQLQTPIVAGVPQIIDTIPPKLLGGTLTDLLSGTGATQSFNVCGFQCGIGKQNYDRFYNYYSGPDNKYGISIATDEPTTVTFNFYSDTGSLTYTDSKLDTVHNLWYTDVPLLPNVKYKINIDLTDASGNVTHIKPPEVNLTGSWK